MAVTSAPILALSEFAQAAVLDASPDYIAAGLDAIEARHGSVTAYLDAELGIDAGQVEQLRQTLLMAG